MARLLRQLALGAAAVVATGLVARAVIRAQRRIDLADKVILITGASRGLGLELARQLCDRGARVAICARDEAELRDAQQDLEARHPAGLLAVACDVTNPEDLARLVEQVRRELGPIDVLINNAGIITVGPFDTLNADEFRQSFATHLSAPLELIKHILPDMRQRGGGRIVNISSIGGKVPVPHMAAYAASKHALVGLSESIRAELIGENIYVTLVCPGLMRTGSPWHARFKGNPQQEFAWFAALDNTPGLSIAANRMAARIIDALEHGDAELTTPYTSKLATTFHGALSGVSTELAGLMARLLPQGREVGAAEAPVKGRTADQGQLPQPLQREQERNAENYNEA